MAIVYKRKIIHNHFTGYLLFDNTPNEMKLYIIVDGKELIYYITDIADMSPTVKKLYVNRVLYNKDFPQSVLSMLKVLDLFNTPLILYLVKDRDTYSSFNETTNKLVCESDDCVDYLKNSFFTTLFTLTKV